MICTAIQNVDAKRLAALTAECEMAEIRLDRCELSKAEIEECFSSDIPLVATCRVSEIMESNPSLSEADALKICESRLSAAIRAGADYVDIELDAPESLVRRISRTASGNGTAIIRSYHDFGGTPQAEELGKILARCRESGADIIKIVTTARTPEDADAVMSLYDSTRNGCIAGNDDSGNQYLIAFCMGDAGRTSRIECLRRGAPFTYASVSADEAAAPGQYPAKEMCGEVYGTGKFVRFGRGRSAESGGVRMPSSKSFVQRAVIAAALASGVSRLKRYSPCDDCEAAIAAARAMGASVVLTPSGDGFFDIEITGIGASAGSVAAECIDVGESGLLARLMIPLMSVLSAHDVIVDGEKTLSNRSLEGAGEIMSGFGVTLVGNGAGPASGSDGADIHVPVKVCGTLSGGRASVNGKYGSQLISGLLMSLPLTEKNSSLVVNDPKSIPYMFLTVDILKHFGVRTSCEMSGGRDFADSDGDWAYCREMTFKTRGGQKYLPAELEAEGDWSAAANFLVAGAIFGRAVLDGLDTSSLQADITVMDILADAGASLSQLDGKQGTVIVQRAPLFAFSADMSNCPDLFPIISVLAAFCQGTSRMAGIDRLANKESDRRKSVMDMLTRLGVDAKVVGNELVVEGQSLAGRCLSGNMLRGGNFSSCHDHRIVMALKVAALGASGPVIIDNEECVSKSFPGFSALFGAECSDK